jgi:hypothetical protein
MRSEATEHHWQLTRYRADEEVETFLERLQDLVPDASWQASIIRVEDGETKSPLLPGLIGDRTSSPLPETPPKNEPRVRFLQGGWWGAGIASLAVLWWLLPRRTPPASPGRDLVLGLVALASGFLGGLLVSLLIGWIRQRILPGERQADRSRPPEPVPPPRPSQPVLLAVRIPTDLTERVAALARELGGEVVQI